MEAPDAVAALQWRLALRETLHEEDMRLLELDRANAMDSLEEKLRETDERART